MNNKIAKQAQIMVFFLFSLLFLPACGGNNPSISGSDRPPTSVNNRRISNNFVCATGSDNVPFTAAQTHKGPIPIIRFISDYFNPSGWTPEKRCEAVTERIKEFDAENRMDYLAIKRKNGYNVVCATQNKGDECLDNEVFLTLKPTDDSEKTLAQIFALREGQAGELLANNEWVQRDAQGNVYIHFATYLELMSSRADSPTK